MNHYLIENSVEKIPKDTILVFIEVLDELRGNFLRKVSGLVAQHIDDILERRDLDRKYVFEGIEGISLKQEPLDSSSFIQFCQIE